LQAKRQEFDRMENTLIDGRYLLLAEIGAGGEARVFRARDQSAGGDVAVRIALRATNNFAPSRTPVHHDGWVRHLASGADPQSGAYQVYELLEGQTLRQLIQTVPFNTGDWHSFVEQSLDSVEALHAADWTHGDLNADNFVRTNAGWKLLELPYLRFDPPAARSTMFGNIHTLAPEQFNGKQADAHSDLYSLGCLYYYAASRVYPHPGNNIQEVAIHCLRFVPESLREKSPGLPASWCDWVMKLIAPQPKDRPASIAAARQLLGVA
jgi:serine/threonine protein kinase